MPNIELGFTLGAHLSSTELRGHLWNTTCRGVARLDDGVRGSKVRCSDIGEQGAYWACVDVNWAEFESAG